VKGEGKNGKFLHLVAFQEKDIPANANVVSMDGHKLSEFMPKHKRIFYRYDFGDDWLHEIKLVKTIENYGDESPRLLEAKGQRPPENIGGVEGFREFMQILKDPKNPRYGELRDFAKDWVRGWTPELSEWDAEPRVIGEWF
jgi:hypothetical protein